MDLSTRVDPANTAEEKTMLMQFLDFQRATVALKARGVHEAGTALPVGASTLTLAGHADLLREAVDGATGE